jgi:CheY-like chemotaxis protein
VIAAYSSRVLVIDDDNAVREFFSKIGRRKGFGVTLAESYFEALEILAEQSFDLIFLDMKMPVKDGLETLKEIRKISSDMKVVIMTGSKKDGQVSIALDKGADSVIFKPFDLSEIMSKVADQGNSSGD